MAGKNESPRQKMINMMYLVLTAMLALQVSDAILQKFVILNNSLELANKSANTSNERTLEAMKVAVDKAGNKPEYKNYEKQAEEVRANTSSIISYIDELKNIVVEAGGGLDPETNQIKFLAEEEKVANIFVGPNRDGKGYELRDKLNAYIAKLNKIAPDLKLPALALDAKDDPAMVSAGQMTSGKDFAQLLFAQTPVPAAIASLSQKQSEIRRVEGEVLDNLAQKVGAKEIKFDKIFAVVIPDSRTVVAGQTYKAEVAIGAFSSAITPRISINGSALPVKDGKGSYSVKTSGGNFDKNGQMKRSYTATISYPKPDGTTETVTQKEEYTILKPSVELMSASLPALYFKCANRLQTSSPGLGALYNPSYSGSGGEFIPGTGGKVTVVPTSSKVTLDVKNGGVLLQSFPFNVRRVPKPTIEVLVNNSPVTSSVTKRGISASQVRAINVRAVADPDFKNNNPEDASYRVSDYDIFLASGSRPKGSLKGKSGQVSVGSLAQQAEAGDRYLIVVNKVQRKNFKGQVEEVNVGEFTVDIPLK